MQQDRQVFSVAYAASFAPVQFAQNEAKDWDDDSGANKVDKESREGDLRS